MNILLLGIIGSGKSTIGARLAQWLSYRFIELDDVVLEHTGLGSVDEIYEHKSSFWKECELEISKDMSLDDKQVIACGGGFADNALNILYFQEHNPVHVIYLHTSPKTLSHRLLSDMDQERLAHHELTDKMSELYGKRDALYRLYANTVVETDGREIKEIVRDIRDQLDRLVAQASSIDKGE
jgi:shikimate kinase